MTDTARPLSLGILAHVDAGKTTLSEGILYKTQSIRSMGRVDSGDTFLDTDEMERARGITIYAKQARFSLERPDGGALKVTLLDTPGHADFSTEMERTLGVLDLAVLLISAAEGVNAQVRLLWKLLDHYQIPALIFVNKMDQAEAEGREDERRKTVLEAIRRELTDGAYPAVEISDPAMAEEIALLDEGLLDQYMAGGEIGDKEIADLIAERKLTPVFFGAALRLRGVDELLEALARWAKPPQYGEAFGARIFKITRDSAGERLTHLKVTGGFLKVRQTLTYTKEDETIEEKITQIRLCSGDRYEQVDEVGAGEICALTGLKGTWSGQGLGAETEGQEALIRPVLTWQIRLRMGEDPFNAYRKLLILSEEEPMFSVSYEERTKKITARLMGEMQREMMKDMAMKRFGLEIAFEQPSVIYKETIASAVEGVGHFEPLRHYAEVHVLLTPGERGSGIVCDSALPTDVLARRWQNLALGALKNRRLRGVLTGAELTDVRITLVAGRAHEKHTEGGDFYQAANRAVRQGLMAADSVLLEPWYEVRIEVPQGNLGRVLTDMASRGAELKAPDFEGERAVVTGRVSVRALGDYAEELASFTKGEGSIVCGNGPYLPCPDPLPVIEAAAYDPESDKRYPPSSVFCEHGAGTIVPWNEVRARMHVSSGLKTDEAGRIVSPAGGPGDSGNGPAGGSGDGRSMPQGNAADAAGRILADAEELGLKGGVSRAGIANRKETELDFRERQKRFFAAEDELKAIFEKTYGPVKTVLPSEERAKYASRAERDAAVAAAAEAYRNKKAKKREEPAASYLLVDGYNIIYAWDDLRELAERDVKAARDRLMDILSNYAGTSLERVILVFDAYKVSGGQERIYTHHNISVIFTKEAETADQYIEKTTRELVKNYRVAVATSDMVEQVIIFGAGARRLSACDLLEAVIRSAEEVRETYLETQAGGKYFLQNNLAEKLSDVKLEE